MNCLYDFETKKWYYQDGVRVTEIGQMVKDFNEVTHARWKLHTELDSTKKAHQIEIDDLIRAQEAAIDETTKAHKAEIDRLNAIIRQKEREIERQLNIINSYNNTVLAD